MRSRHHPVSPASAERGTPEFSIQSTAGSRRRLEPRGGGIIVIAMICVLLTGFLVVHVAQLIVGHYKQQRLAQQNVQADWLAESAADRAAFRLRREPDYMGETWTVPAEDLDGIHAGRVTINIERPPNAAARVTVRATYPVESTTPTRSTKTFAVSVTERPAGPAIAEPR